MGNPIETIVAGKKDYMSVLHSFIVPFKIDLSEQEGDISISKSNIVTTKNESWIYLLEYSLPYNVTVDIVRDVTEKEFNDMVKQW